MRGRVLQDEQLPRRRPPHQGARAPDRARQAPGPGAAAAGALAAPLAGARLTRCGRAGGLFAVGAPPVEAVPALWARGRRRGGGRRGGRRRRQRPRRRRPARRRPARRRRAAARAQARRGRGDCRAVDLGCAREAVPVKQGVVCERADRLSPLSVCAPGMRPSFAAVAATQNSLAVMPRPKLPQHDRARCLGYSTPVDVALSRPGRACASHAECRARPHQEQALGTERLPTPCARAAGRPGGVGGRHSLLLDDDEPDAPQHAADGGGRAPRAAAGRDASGTGRKRDRAPDDGRDAGRRDRGRAADERSLGHGRDGERHRDTEDVHAERGRRHEDRGDRHGERGARHGEREAAGDRDRRRAGERGDGHPEGRREPDAERRARSREEGSPGRGRERQGRGAPDGGREGDRRHEEHRKKHKKERREHGDRKRRHGD